MTQPIPIPESTSVPVPVYYPSEVTRAEAWVPDSSSSPPSAAVGVGEGRAGPDAGTDEGEGHSPPSVPEEGPNRERRGTRGRKATPARTASARERAWSIEFPTSISTWT